MRITRDLSLSLLIVALLSGCEHSDLDDHTHDDDHSHADESSLSFTHYTDETELFVEFPALVVGVESQFAAHVTQLSNHEPLLDGQLDVVLHQGRVGVGLDVVDRHEGKPPGPGEGLGRREPDEERADEPRPLGHRHRVEVVQRDRGFAQGLLDHG